MNSCGEWILLSKIPYLGPKRCRELVEYFGSPREVLSAPFDKLSKIPGIGKEIAKLIISEARKINVEEDLNLLRKFDVQVITFQDKQYPSNLQNIFDPPFLLYVRGELREEDKDALAIVGTRRATIYGKLTAQRLAREVAKEGITIVSGMARGIDTAAHWGALEAEGRTIAVMGCGVDRVYPPENKELMNKIIERGAVISEFPLRSLPEASHFPQRNRIISGLSRGVLVVEAPLKSGALITAEFALEQGREVFAVPGNINSPKSQGTNRLIREGAKLVEKTEDIFEELNFSPILSNIEVIKNKESLLSPEEKRVLALIKEKPLHIDSLVEKSGFPASKVAAILMKLQIKGFIREFPGKVFVRS
ncbi:DNA-processing protein DprA [Candidatus Aerophobetes bacterium]|nr:DNA-processing protein DprA [Candidatus Aerophobetes bacterium]